MLKHKQTNRGRQVALLASTIDPRNHFLDRYFLAISDFFEARPKSLFKANAGLMPGDKHGAFQYRRFAYCSQQFVLIRFETV
jgi:hypothetical protein